MIATPSTIFKGLYKSSYKSEDCKINDLHKAVIDFDVSRIKSLISEKPELMHERDKFGCKPVDIAYDLGYDDLVHLFAMQELSEKSLGKN